MTNARKKRVLFRAAGHALSIGAPAIATATQFPIWISGGSKQTVSGIALVLLIVSAFPAYKALKDKLKSPSAFLIWLVLFALVASLTPIVDQLYVVALVGLVSGGMGTVFYKLGDRALPNGDKGEADK